MCTYVTARAGVAAGQLYKLRVLDRSAAIVALWQVAILFNRKQTADSISPSHAASIHARIYLRKSIPLERAARSATLHLTIMVTPTSLRVMLARTLACARAFLFAISRYSPAGDVAIFAAPVADGLGCRAPY